MYQRFRDLKSLLGLEKIMNKKQVNMEKMVAMVMTAYAIGLLVGEAVRDHLFGREQATQPESPSRRRSERELYSGLFILLKRKPRLPPKTIGQIARSVLDTFLVLGHQPV